MYRHTRHIQKRQIEKKFESSRINTQNQVARIVNDRDITFI